MRRAIDRARRRARATRRAAGLDPCDEAVAARERKQFVEACASARCNIHEQHVGAISLERIGATSTRMIAQRSRAHAAPSSDPTDEAWSRLRRRAA
jgi:hypothetical protein